jgi:hypothetical protein
MENSPGWGLAVLYQGLTKEFFKPALKLNPGEEWRCHARVLGGVAKNSIICARQQLSKVNRANMGAEKLI